MQQLPFFALLFVGLYFLMIRPQKKRQEAQRQLLSKLGDGAEVMTGSGLYGFVTAVEDDVLWIEIADGVQVRMAKGSVVKVIDTPGDGTAAPPSAGTASTEPGDGGSTPPPESDPGGSGGAN